MTPQGDPGLRLAVAVSDVLVGPKFSFGRSVPAALLSHTGGFEAFHQVWLHRESTNGRHRLQDGQESRNMSSKRVTELQGSTGGSLGVAASDVASPTQFWTPRSTVPR